MSGRTTMAAVPGGHQTIVTVGVTAHRPRIRPSPADAPDGRVPAVPGRLRTSHQHRSGRAAGGWSAGAVNDRAAPPDPAQQPASRAVSRTVGSTAGVAAVDAPGSAGSALAEPSVPPPVPIWSRALRT